MLQKVKSAFDVLARGSAEHLAGMGITEADWNLFTGAAPWTAADRNRVRNTCDAVTHGALDFLGLPRFEVPAEYIAAVITMFVGPVNWQVAARWFETGRTTEDLASLPDTGAAPMSAQQLFSLCLEANDDDVSAFRAKFEKRVGRAVAHAVEGDPKKK